ncbi:ABC transporter permease [Arsenicitalea aurantiaca]|uniref:ABC transporter permease n=1 Tax=Arsenicitalea aurantiaca TaxID=1783274 RepID=A0A433X3U3_9HYPH|nr:ABC transporter permease [Arsenicitalea aurantiaca]RUT28763.1 ABC transporter permease [Arsenicitalea aurantiaca]
MAMLRFAPPLALALLIVPIGLGFLGILASAFGLQLGDGLVSTEAFEAALALPGLQHSTMLSLWIGPAAAFLSLGLVALFFAGWLGTRFFRGLSALMAPILAIPHAAAGFGLAFLIAPSGLLLRLVSPELTGLSRPPDWLILNDPAGLSLLFGLVLKEVPFLFLVALAALPQADAPARMAVMASLGYGRVRGFFLSVFPALYGAIRLPVYAVIAFSGAVVDLALILGPNTPPTLAVRILTLVNDPDLAMRPVAAAASLLQLGITLCSLLLWRLGEGLCARIFASSAGSGRRGLGEIALRWSALAGVGLLAALSLAGIVVLLLWSIASGWRFPDAFPQALSLGVWQAQWPAIAAGLGTATMIGLLATTASSALAIAVLEAGDRAGRQPFSGFLWLFTLPILVPQVTLLAGLSLLLIGPGLDGTLASVVAIHFVFVFPYVYLTLAGYWPRFDRRNTDLALTLGRSPAAAFTLVKLPMLVLPILTAFGLGFAVSVAQYLPTQMIGAGRITTITTDAVSLASGGDRRLIGAYGFAQTLLAFLAFLPPLLLLALARTRRRGLVEGVAR